MDFEVLILGSDANAYYMARCCYEAYKIKPHLIGQKVLAFTRFTDILTIEYYDKLWIEECFLGKINDYAKNTDKSILLVSTNETYTEFISKNREKIDAKYKYIVPNFEIVKTLTNKENFYKTYEKNVLSFPKTIYFDCSNDSIDKINIDFPLVLKPANVVSYNHISFEGKNKIYKIKNKVELVDVVGKIKNSEYNDRMIVQEFIDGDDSYLFDSVVYINSKGKCEYISFAQIGLQEQTRSMVGNAAVLINGYNSFGINVLEQQQKIISFMEKIGYRGFAEIDMKYDKKTNEFKVLEINCRQGRCSYYLTPIGCNLIRTMIEDLFYGVDSDCKFLDKEYLLTFVPKGIIKKYCVNDEFKREALRLYKEKKYVKPLDCKYDKNIKRFLQLRKRWFNYYKEYKNSYWK